MVRALKEQLPNTERLIRTRVSLVSVYSPKQGVVFTMDALHCKKTTGLIIEGGNDYVITVKGNQPQLLTQRPNDC